MERYEDPDKILSNEVYFNKRDHNKKGGNRMIVVYILSALVYIPLAVLFGLADKYK